MNLSQTYLQGRMHVLAGTVARTCGDGCTYLRERLLVLAWRMQCTARTDAVHCRSGCSALRLRWVKLAPKSPVLFYKVSDLHTDDHSGAVWKAKQKVPPKYACQNPQNGGGAKHLFHYTHRCPLCHKAGCVQDGRSGLPHLRSPDGKLHREKWG